jgi:hypothetical protein
MKKVFFHIHIWKTGGTSFLTICRENFGKSFHRDNMLVQDWFLSAQQLRWLLEYHDWVRCYSCHMLSGELPYDTDVAKVIGVAFVRNPVDRFISSYNFQRGDKYRGGIAKDHNFDEFYKKAIVDTVNPMWRDGQTFVLGGSGTDDGMSLVSERVKNGQIILLPTERFDESCILLERLFPEDFKDCSYIRYNVSQRNEVISEHQRAAISQYMNTDFKLVTFANDYLDSTLDRLFPDLNERRQYVDDFRHRCKMKKRRKRLINLAGKMKSVIKACVKGTSNAD